MKTAFLFMVLVAGAANAQDTGGIARLSILPGWQMDNGHQMAGLHITLAPGWKTYWRAPGDAGIPPAINFDGSVNLSSASFMWPTPQVFDQNGMRSIGYHDDVVIPLEIAPTGDGPVKLTGHIAIGVCAEICVPVTLDFDALLPPLQVSDPAILAALAHRPLTASEAGASATCIIGPTDQGLTVTAHLSLPDTGGSEVVVIETGDPQVWVSEASVTRAGAVLSATSDLVHVSGTAFALDRSALRFTVLGADHAVDIRGCAAE